MSASVTIYQGDTLPAYPTQLLDENSNPINLTGLSGSNIAMKFLSTNLAPVAGTATTGAGTITITNATTGAISYAWNSADTATAGTYNMWFIVTNGSVKEHAVGPIVLTVSPAP